MRRRRRIPTSIRLAPRWRRHGIPALVLTLLCGGVVYDRSRHGPRTGHDMEQYHDRTFRAVHVVDGDTLDIGSPDGRTPTTRVRLWGVDTPETGHGNTPEMYFGREAKDYARAALEGRDVHLVLAESKTRDKYGRLLAYVYLERGAAMFNERLLEQGLAYADWRFPHAYADAFTAAERRARRDGVGMWADITAEQMPPWRQRMERERMSAGRRARN